MSPANPYLAPTKALRLGLSIAAIMVCIGTCAYVATVFDALPATIPTHFDLAGHVDGHGGKSALWVAAIVSLLLTLAIVAMQFSDPKRANYPFRITAKSADVAYSVMPVFTCFCALVIAVTFALVELMIVNPHAASVYSQLLLVPIVLLLGGAGAYIWWLWRLERRPAPVD